MNYLLDTHIVDWASLSDSRLSEKVNRIILNAKTKELAISDVTLTELARLLFEKTITTPYSPQEWMARATSHLTVIPVSREIALRAAYLDWSHRDPCDRHIVATAIEHKLPLITIDEKMHTFTANRELKVIW